MNTLILDILCKQLGGMYKLLGVCGPLGSYVENVCQLDICISIVYIIPTIGECMSVGEYIDIGYILPTIRGVYVEVAGYLWGLRALGGKVCQLDICISIVYIMPTIRGGL